MGNHTLQIGDFPAAEIMIPSGSRSSACRTIFWPSLFKWTKTGTEIHWLIHRDCMKSSFFLDPLAASHRTGQAFPLRWTLAKCVGRRWQPNRPRLVQIGGWAYLQEYGMYMYVYVYVYIICMYNIYICMYVSLCICCICIYLFHRFRSSDAVGNGLKTNTHLPQRQNMPLFEMIWKKQLKAMHRRTPYAFEQFQWHVSYKALRRWIWHHAVMLHWTGPRGIGAIHAGKCWILNVVKPTIN